MFFLGLFSLQWLLLASIKGPTWDAAFYYVLARSPIFDGDLKLQNDLLLSYNTASPDFVAKNYHESLTGTGRVASPYAIGTPILWLPIMALLRLFTLFPSNAVATGFEWPFVASIASFSAICGMLAFWLSYKMARSEVGQTPAMIATMTLMFATPLLYYQFREPMYSHTSSALIATLCIYYWNRTRHVIGSRTQALSLGALIGFAGLTRWQNLMYLVLPLASTSIVYLSLPREKKREHWWRALQYVTLVITASLAIFSVQMAIWQLFYGRWATVPQGGAYVDWRAPFFIPVLFSTFRGLLPWMPVVFLSVIGVAASLGKGKAQLALPLLLLLLLETYVNSSTRDWFGGGGFGPRRYTSELVIWILGYAYLVRQLPRYIRAFLFSTLGFLLALHQWLLLRYGLTERIGGKVLSMYPTYTWTDVGLREFALALTNHLPDLIERPLDFLVFSGSPLFALITRHVLPAQHIFPFLTMGILVGGGLSVARRATQHRLRNSATTGRNLLLTAITGVTLIAVMLWILYLA